MLTMLLSQLQVFCAIDKLHEFNYMYMYIHVHVFASNLIRNIIKVMENLNMD